MKYRQPTTYNPQQVPDREIEVRFLEIDKDGLVDRLRELNAKEIGDDHIHEIIFYDKDMKFLEQCRFVRIRDRGGVVKMTYKHNETMSKGDVNSVADVREVEFDISDMKAGKRLLEQIGLVAYREQEKKRHSFILDDVVLDIDTWPSVPPYVELEGPSEKHLKDVARKLELDWDDVYFGDARDVLEKEYDIPIGADIRVFTFDNIE